MLGSKAVRTPRIFPKAQPQAADSQGTSPPMWTACAGDLVHLKDSFVLVDLIADRVQTSGRKITHPCSHGRPFLVLFSELLNRIVSSL
jgi:hypothetical protein